MLNENEFYAEAFSRNNGLLTPEQQAQLRNMTIAIPGLGGVGALYASTFARLGFGKFHIADLDTYEVVNINRQQSATMDTVGTSKVEAVEKMIHSINPYAKVTTFPQGIHTENIDSFLSGVDVVVDALDFFAIETRRMLFLSARKQAVFAVSAGPVGFGSSMLVFNPHGMSFDEYFDICDEQTKEMQLLRFGLGLTPTLLQRRYFKPEGVDWKEKKAPSLVTGTLLCANLVSTEVLKILFHQKVYPVPHSLHFDPYLRTLKKVYIPFGNRNPWQKLKLFVALQILKSKGRI